MESHTRTCWGIGVDPLQHLLLRQTPEVPPHLPLLLDVGHALHGHEGHHPEGDHVVLVAVSQPAEELRGAEREAWNAENTGCLCHVQQYGS